MFKIVPSPSPMSIGVGEGQGEGEGDKKSPRTFSSVVLDELCTGT